MKRTQQRVREDGTRIVSSDRRTVSLCVDRDGILTVRVPRRMTQEAIDRLIEQRRPWIERARERMRSRTGEECLPSYTEEELRRAAEDTKRRLSDLIPPLARQIGVHPAGVRVKRQRSRFGSASTKGNLNFNATLSLMPERVFYYVVVHELCHLVHMDHSAAFWALVGRYCEDYRTSRAYLREHGHRFLSRL